MTLKLTVDATTLRFGADGTATGVVYWEVLGKAFPESTWNDFVLVVVGWWLDSAIRLARGESSEEKLQFMDGPFEVAVELRNGMIMARCMDTRHKAACTMAASVTRDHFLNELSLAANELREYCRHLNQDCNDLNRLEASSRRLRRLLASE
jgi:hypothetical protein